MSMIRWDVIFKTISMLGSVNSGSGRDVAAVQCVSQARAKISRPLHRDVAVAAYKPRGDYRHCAC
jgi:hypothetical protein